VFLPNFARPAAAAAAAGGEWRQHRHLVVAKDIKTSGLFYFILFYFSSRWRNGESCVSPSTSTSLLFSRFTISGVLCVCVSLVAVIVSIVNVADGRRFS
jgi:hypothetical protein